MITPCPVCSQPSCRQCADCGKWECEHHTFVPTSKPDGCVCDAQEWGDPTHLPPVCDKYDGPEDHSTNCDKCEHDFECHKEAKGIK